MGNMSYLEFGCSGSLKVKFYGAAGRLIIILYMYVIPV